MTASLRVLTVRTVDSSPSLLFIEPNGNKTLVNCGEGCQRSFLEHSQKLSTVHRICLTHLAHDSVGGLPGTVLTSADAAKASQVDRLVADMNDSSSQFSANNNEALSLQGLEIIGPPGIRHYMGSLRHFVRRDDFPITVREGSYHVGPVSSDQELASRRSRKKKRKRTTEDSTSEPTEIPSYFGVQSIPIAYEIPRYSPENNNNNNNQAANEGQQQTVISSYLFTTPPVAGKFLPEMARALGIPPGPLYGKLKAGKDIDFVDAHGVSHHVKSSDVVLESTPGRMVAVLYYPTVDAWKTLQAQLEQIGLCPVNHQNTNQTVQQQASRIKNNTTTNAVLELVVHMTTREVFETDICQRWRQQLQASLDKTRDNASTNVDDDHHIHHLFVETSDPAIWKPSCEEKSLPSPFTSACVGALIRSKICSQLYQIPDYLTDGDNDKNNDEVTQSSNDNANNNNNNNNNPLIDEGVWVATPLLDYVFMPRSRKGFVDGHPKQYLEDRRREGLDFMAQSGAIEHAKQILNAMHQEQDNNINNNKGYSTNNNSCKAGILFTGTGSAIPCKHRNVTGMYLRMKDGQGILLDVGEGTVGQLLRVWSSDDENAADLLMSIKAAWVSHPHADHHLGLLRLLTDRKAAWNHTHRGEISNGRHTTKFDPVVVIGPPPILDFLKEYEQSDPRIVNSYLPLDCRELQANPNRPRIFNLEIMKENSLLGNQITHVEAIPVAHCPYSYAVVLEGTTFGKVAYSGDCRPSNRFAQRAKDADLLIHEATFEDGMEAEAAMKRHCTVGEALGIAKEMGAKQLVLTHFSQRYPKIPPIVSFNNNGDASNDIPVIFAFDFMMLTPTNLQVASQLTPALRRLYPEEQEDERDANDSSTTKMMIDNDPTATNTSTAAEAMSVPGFFARNPYE